MKKITIDISPTGEISMEDDHGSASDVTQLLEKALGQVVSKKKTCSARPKATTQSLKQTNG